MLMLGSPLKTVASLFMPSRLHDTAVAAIMVGQDDVISIGWLVPGQAGLPELLEAGDLGSPVIGVQVEVQSVQFPFSLSVSQSDTLDQRRLGTVTTKSGAGHSSRTM